MTRMIKNWRYWLIMAIGFAAFVCLIGAPNENSPLYWEILILSKFAAVVLTIFDVALYTWFAMRGEIDDVHDFLIDE